MDYRQAPSSNNQGIAMVVAIMIATTFSGLFLGWQYLKNMQSGGQGLRETAALTRIANSVASRISQVLPLTTDPTGNCSAAFLAANFQPFLQFNTPAAPLNLTLTSAGVQGCLVKIPPSPVVEFGPGSPLSALQISIQQVGAPDQTSLFSTVSVSVAASSTIAGSPSAHAAHSVSVSSKILLWVDSLSGYNLVLYGGPLAGFPAATQISVAKPLVNGLPSLEVMGSVLYADNTATNPLPLTKVVQTNPLAVAPVPVSPVTFDGAFDIQVASFNYINSTPPVGCPAGAVSCPLDLSLMGKTFKGGLNVNVMYQAIATLPIYDNGPTGGAFTWNEQIDYSTAGGALFPMPNIGGIGGAPAEVPLASMYGVAAPPGGVLFPPGTPAGVTPFNAAESNAAAYTGIAGSVFNQAAMVGGGYIVPDPAPAPASTSPNIVQLQDTCAPEGIPNTPPPNEFVFLQLNQNLGIDFTGTPGGNGAPIFCGLIAAKDLYIYAPAGAVPYYVFGLIIARSVTILGGGQVVFANPMDNTPISPNPFLAGQTQAGVAQDMTWLAMTYGHNFFVPIFQTIPAPGALDTYRPHGALRETGAGGEQCCGTPNGTNIADTVGFVCTCANDSTAACPQAPPDPLNPNYCIASPGAPTAAQNMTNLFSAGNLPKLLFMTKVTQ